MSRLGSIRLLFPPSFLWNPLGRLE
jgi:hypothetical protein